MSREINIFCDQCKQRNCTITLTIDYGRDEKHFCDRHCLIKFFESNKVSREEV